MKSPRIVVVRRAAPEQESNPEQDEPQSTTGVVRPMPRRQVTHSISQLQVALPRARRVVFRASALRAFSRLFVWLWGFLRFYVGNIYDSIQIGRAHV